MSNPNNGLATVQPSAPAPTPIRGPRMGLPTQDELAALRQYGEIIVKSGMAPQHIRTPEAAIVAMRYGHQLGIDEFTALQNMFVVNGKPSSMASLLHSLILRDHGGDAVQVVESNGQRCVLRCKRRDSSHTTEISYTIEEAEAAGLKDGNWKKYPADMLFARCISRAGRQVFRDSTMGMYTPEELGADVIEVAGEVIVGRPVTATVVEESTPVREAPANKLARLHAVGAERGLDHDALRRVMRFRLPRLTSMAELTEATANDLATEIETAGEEQLVLWALDWEAEIAAAERIGPDALHRIAEQMRANGIASRSHPWIAAAWQAANRRLESRPPAGVLDADVTELPGMPADASHYTA